MTPLKNITRLIPLLLVALLPLSRGETVSLDAVQTGGFFADGPPSNLPSFQNYYVGYGTTPGFSRTSERRSFFWFDLHTLAGRHIESATMHLELPFGGLIFGLGPGDPPGPESHEVFALGATPLPPSIVTDPGLTLGEAAGVFASLKGMPVATPVDFEFDTPPGTEIVIPLDLFGVSLLNTHTGGAIILSGWMPSWSFDARLAPIGSPVEFLEASELIFGLTDVHAGAVAKPKLTLTLAPVPTPDSGPTSVLLLAALATVAVLRRFFFSRAGFMAAERE